MFNGIESRGGVKHGGLVYCLYFIILVVFGNCILRPLSCYCFLLFSYYLFLTIPIRSIVSKSTRPIFPNFFRFGRTMAVVCKSAPCSRQITTPAPHHSVFTGPSCRPTNSVKALKANRVRITTFNLRYDTIRYDTRCYFNVRSKADIRQLNLPHGTDN